MKIITFLLILFLLGLGIGIYYNFQEPIKTYVDELCYYPEDRPLLLNWCKLDAFKEMSFQEQKDWLKNG